MSAVYLGAPGFVKVVVAEPESTPLRRFLTGRHPLVALLRTEALRAVRHTGPQALEGVREALRTVDLVAVDDRILEAAGVLDPGIVRTLDAIHLATALALGEDLDTIVTYDERMAQGAALLGLPIARPR